MTILRRTIPMEFLNYCENLRTTWRQEISIDSAVFIDQQIVFTHKEMPGYKTDGWFLKYLPNCR